MRYRKSKRDGYICRGGPWDGQLVMLPRETMVFTVGSHVGRYVLGGWRYV